MSEQQKKTPSKIADDIVTLYWTLSDMERVSGALFLMIEQAIKAEREEAQALRIELATLRADVTVLTEYRDRMREELDHAKTERDDALRGQDELHDGLRYQDNEYAKLMADLKNAETCVKWHREKLLRLSEENGRLRDVLKSIPTVLTELSQVLRKAPGDEALRIAEHDACLIAIGFMQGPVDKILSNLPETERHLKIREAERELLSAGNVLAMASKDTVEYRKYIKVWETLEQLQKESEGK
jgi:hypothetical protein